MNFIKNLFEKGKTAGFTMIELLVVISVIGVLAVAVLSSINPIEQVNKGRDTRTRSDAAQMINAIDRYVAIHEEFPWNTTDAANYPQLETAFEIAPTVWSGYTPTDWPQLLASTSEVKQGFIDRQTTNANIFLYKGGTYDSTVIACFVPASNAFKQEAYDDCQAGEKTATLNTSTTLDLCPADTDPAGDNYLCIP